MGYWSSKKGSHVDASGGKASGRSGFHSDRARLGRVQARRRRHACAEGHRTGDRAGRVHCAAGSFGLRQVDAAQRDWRHGASRPWRGSHRRHAGDGADRPLWRRVPAAFAVPLDDGAGQRGFRPAHAGSRFARGRGSRVPGPRRPGEVLRGLPGAAFRRHAAARRHRARARPAARRAAWGWAPSGARRQAGGAAEDLVKAQDHGRVRHARRGRSALSFRPRLRHDQFARWHQGGNPRRPRQAAGTRGGAEREVRRAPPARPSVDSRREPEGVQRHHQLTGKCMERAIRTNIPPRISARSLLAGPGWAANTLWAAIGIGVFVLVWTAIALQLQNPVLLPTPAVVLEGFYRLLADGYLVNDVLASLKRVFVGFLMASAVGVPLALLLAYFVPLRRLILPVVTLIRPLPPIACIPLAILWFGVGDKPSFFITAIAAFFPIFLNSFFGGMSVEDQHLNAARSLGAKKVSLVIRIMFPSALPMIWTGLKIGLGQSWMAGVTAELIAGESGLGYMIQMSRLNLETAYVLVGMVTIGVLGSLMGAALSGVERYVLPWKSK